tara:strand:- start:2572 stop:3894 length:1323 start_codon:yes stop_codon:yes gene_type:complete
MSKSKLTLPQNCEIEVLEHGRKTRDFRLVFESPDGNDYRSEVYHPRKGEQTKRAAYEVCKRYGWLDHPPATGVLTIEELHKLERLVDDAIDDMDRNTRRYVPDSEKAWREIFDFSDGEFWSSGDDLLACGDPPIPEQDCDFDDGWTAYNYTQDIGRVIPGGVKSVEVKQGPRGIELITFHSGDCDGNWDVEAEFVRFQPGAKITEEDKQLAAEAHKACDAAREAYNAASQKDANYGDLLKAWRKAGDLVRITNMLHHVDGEEEYWDPDDFAYHAVRMNCYWTLLRYQRYEIWCAIRGEDPLSNVSCEHEDVDAVYDVTACVRKGKTEISAEHVSGTLELEDEAMDYLGKNDSVEEIKKIVQEFPKGRPIKLDTDRWGMRKGWEPLKVAVASVTLRVTLRGSRDLPMTPLRVRQVSCKGLAEDVMRMMHQIDKHFPKEETP